MPVLQNESPKPEVQKIHVSNADVLSAAAASGDQAVHDLLGHRAIAELNQDSKALKEIDDKLAELLNLK